MGNQQFNRREFNVSASVAVATTTSPLAGVSLDRYLLDDLAAPLASGLANRSMSEAAIDRMCRKIVLSDCADSLVRHPDSFSATSWQEQVQTFQEMGGVPGSFPDLLRHVLTKPGSLAHNSLLSASPEARMAAVEKIDELSHLPISERDLGQTLRHVENALGHRLDLMYRLYESAPDSFRAPMIEASLWNGNSEE